MLFGQTKGAYFWRKRAGILLTETLLGMTLASAVVAILGLSVSSTISANGAVIGGLAGGFVAFVISARKLSRDTGEKRTIVAPNPLSLIEMLRQHGVREFGSMYLYMPMPKRAEHEAAWVWIETLSSEALIKGDPWYIKADHVKQTLRQSHAHLFAGEVDHFNVYRLDWAAVSALIGEELE